MRREQPRELPTASLPRLTHRLHVPVVAASDKLEPMRITLQDEVAVVTGGSRGIGAATVKVLVAAGAKVVFNYHRGNQAAKEVIKCCKGLEGQAIAERADVSSMADAKRLAEVAVNHFGKVDILVAFVKGLSTELAPHGILVNCLAPGWVETEMSTPVLNDKREYKRAISLIPLRRFARAEEIALPILFLASPMATFITGEILNVNGGSVLCG